MPRTRAVWIACWASPAQSRRRWWRDKTMSRAASTPTPSGRIDAIFAPWTRPPRPAAPSGVSRNGAVVYARGYGMANLEYDAAISPDSIFHVASISKQFAAFSVALLAADGKLSLDDEVRKHLPEIPDFGKRLTVRHLMHHTSGLRDQWTLQDYAGWREDDLITEADVLRRWRPPARPQLRPRRGVPLQQHRLHAARRDRASASPDSRCASSPRRGSSRRSG